MSGWDIRPFRAFRQESVKLVFIRLMRDVVYHHRYKPEGAALWMDAEDSGTRRQYLKHFADQEGKAYLRRFYAKYRNKTPQEAMDLLAGRIRSFPKRLATIYRSVYPHRDLAAFRDYLTEQRAAQGLSAEAVADLYEKYFPERFATFHFAAETPYETLMHLKEAQGRRVMAPEVAAAARSALIDVVEQGTAIRVKGVYTGSAAAHFRFTSALPVQVLKYLAPTLQPLVVRAYTEPPETGSYTVTAATAGDARPAQMTRY